MKKIKVFLLSATTLCTLLCTPLFITSCASTKTEDNLTETTEKEEISDVSESDSADETVKIVVEPEKPKKPEDPPNVAFVKKLQIELENNNLIGAIALFDEIPEELVDDLDLKNLLGALYYSATQFDNAISTAKLILEIDETNTEALELLSMSYRAMGNRNEYKKTAEQILATDPYNPAINIEFAKDYALNKKYKQAKDSYRKALKGDSSNIDAMFGYAQMSYYLDDMDTAQRIFEKILDQDPANPQALAYLGKLSSENENYLKAVNYVLQAIKSDPVNYDYWIDLGNYNRFLGKFSEAEKAWITATELDPTYFLAYAYLAGNYDDLGQIDLALKNYHKVIETNPKYYFAYEETAILEFHMGNYENAIKYFTKAYEYSEDYSYKLMIAASLTKIGKKLDVKNLLNPILKKMDKDSVEYAMVRFYSDSYSKNAESNLINKINKEEDRNKRGKMLFYMGLYYELNNFEQVANEYYTKVTNMKAPMFFEYRLAEWGIKE